jgi:hypothetical protein
MSATRIYLPGVSLFLKGPALIAIVGTHIYIERGGESISNKIFHFIPIINIAD